jgi:hypothetical protein
MQSCELYLELEEIEPVEGAAGDLFDDYTATSEEEEEIDPDNIDTGSGTEAQQVRVVNPDERVDAGDPTDALIPDVQIGEFVTVGGETMEMGISDQCTTAHECARIHAAQHINHR